MLYGDVNVKGQPYSEIFDGPQNLGKDGNVVSDNSIREIYNFLRFNKSVKELRSIIANQNSVDISKDHIRKVILEAEEFINPNRIYRKVFLYALKIHLNQGSAISLGFLKNMQHGALYDLVNPMTYRDSIVWFTIDPYDRQRREIRKLLSGKRWEYLKSLREKHTPSQRLGHIKIIDLLVHVSPPSSVRTVEEYRKYLSVNWKEINQLQNKLKISSTYKFSRISKNYIDQFNWLYLNKEKGLTSSEILKYFSEYLDLDEDFRSYVANYLYKNKDL